MFPHGGWLCTAGSGLGLNAEQDLVGQDIHNLLSSHLIVVFIKYFKCRFEKKKDFLTCLPVYCCLLISVL